MVLGPIAGPSRRYDPSVRIAVVGWGSLIWHPASLRVSTRWRRDGPRLPVEFARISKDGRLTLVIRPGSEDQTTYWAVSELTALDEARNNVRARENSGLTDIHYVRRDDRAEEAVPRDMLMTISTWLAGHQDVDAVMWTALPSNWRDKRQSDFTPEDALEYVRELRSANDQTRYLRAREYVTKAPPQIDTAVRRALRRQGWKDAQLPTLLFDE